MTSGRAGARPGQASTRAVVVVDVQNDFVSGSLATATGADAARRITPFIRDARNGGETVIGTQDWHIDPAGHFAPEGQDPDYRETWPVHCLAGATGAEPHPELDAGAIQEWFRKGEYTAAYSGFEGHAAEDAEVRLEAWLRRRGIQQLAVVGIATDYCVKATALDAARAGFDVTVLEDLCAPVSEEGGAQALAEMAEAGIRIETSDRW
ncbi:isochorismatase family protein [Corynebacterium heidelbergense]|uniref:nicotinamidase n=1 Tax=Corynebacterium heidelbergense TaxID=2055947 RepID=A0A364V9W1_9CORY|nr:isochorismatase family protein [Corynebacterium heidelbergense]RAV33450.1 nicotinamidase [Corynebacterium heidelbergense]WCZ37063.1 Streptothricin hydrolase [Corynebacterium heidelbergense]